MPRRREIAVFLLLTLIWGTTWAAIRFGLGGVPPLAGVGIRFATAGLLLLAVALWRKERLGGSTRERWLWLFNGLATFVVPYGIIYWSEQVVPSGLAAVLFSTFPLWLVVWSRWFLPSERPTLGRFAAVALGFAGVAVIFSEDFGRLGGGEIRWRGAFLLLAAAVSASGSVAVKRWGSGISLLSLSAVPMLVAGVVCGGMSLLLERGEAFEWSAAPIAATLYLALFGSAVSFTLYFWLLARTSAVQVSLISYTAPVVAVLVGVLVLDEPLTLRMIAGGLLVLGGVAAVLRAR